MPSTYNHLVKSREGARDRLLEWVFRPGSRLHHQAVREMEDYNRRVDSWFEQALADGRFCFPAEFQVPLRVLYITGENHPTHSDQAFESALAAPHRYNLIVFRDLPHIQACADRHRPQLMRKHRDQSLPPPVLFPILNAPSTATGLGLLFNVLLEFGRVQMGSARSDLSLEHVESIDIFAPPNKNDKIEIELNSARAQLEVLQGLAVRLVNSTEPIRRVYQSLATLVLKRVLNKFGDEAVFNARALGKSTLSEEISTAMKLRANNLVRWIKRAKH